MDISPLCIIRRFRYGCSIGPLLVVLCSQSAGAVDWDSRLRQSDRDVALFHSMQSKLKLTPANPASIGSGGQTTSEAVAGNPGQPSYVGRWAHNLSWCRNGSGTTDQVPVVLTANKLVGYENECRFKNVVADAGGWSVTAVCEAEGTTYGDAFRLEVRGDRLTQRTGGKSVTWQRCTAAASRPKAPTASTNQERIAAGQELRREFARQCPERNLQWLDGATELQGFEDYGSALSAAGRSALVDAATPDLARCQAGVDCQSSAYVVAVHRLGWAAAAADNFCRHSRLSCTEPYDCSVGRRNPIKTAGREPPKGSGVTSVATAAVPPGRCRFPELLDQKVQEEANRAIAKVGLDRSAAPEKFVMTNTQFELTTVSDPKQLDVVFSTAEEGENCFPAFKEKRRQLRLEYDAIRSRVSQGISDARVEKLPTEVRAAFDARKKACGDDRIKLGSTFVDRRDVNGDGADDYVLDYGQFECGRDTTFFCGTTGCATEVFIASKGTFEKVLDESLRSIRFQRVQGRYAMMLGLHGSHCGKAGFEACGSTLYWNGMTFSPAH